MYMTIVKHASPAIHNKRGGEWSFNNSGSRKILVEFDGSRSLSFLAVMCVSQSRFLYEGVSESRFFARLRVSKSRFDCLFVLFLVNIFPC